jgi:hypothetical protein
MQQRWELRLAVFFDAFGMLNGFSIQFTGGYGSKFSPISSTKMADCILTMTQICGSPSDLSHSPVASGELWGTIWGNFRFSDGVPSTCCPSFGTSGSSEVFPRPHFTMRGVILGQTNFPDLWGFYSSRTKEGFNVNPGLGGYSPNSHNLILKWYPRN